MSSSAAPTPAIFFVQALLLVAYAHPQTTCWNQVNILSWLVVRLGVLVLRTSVFAFPDIAQAVGTVQAADTVQVADIEAVVDIERAADTVLCLALAERAFACMMAVVLDAFSKLKGASVVTSDPSLAQ
jgi:hypothetical protein